jgi:hypothetical protein
LALISLLILPVAACDCSDSSGSPDGGSTLDGTVGFDASGDGPIVVREGGVTVTDDGGTWTCYVTTCDGHGTECGDCMDNDGDGLVDSRDPECLGPCDNTEYAALTTGVGGERGASCNRDCYFDFGNGSGNDTCRWDTLCDDNEPDSVCPYDEGELGGMRCPDTQTEMCLDVCRPLTPNGCDCFGCCTFDALAGRAEADGGEWVWLGSGISDSVDGEGTCTFDDIMDTDLCKPCEPVADCFNDCGECELCLGRDTLPDECLMDYPDASVMDAGSYPPPRCPEGVQPCGLAGDEDCPLDYYCVTGCCIPTII